MQKLRMKSAALKLSRIVEYIRQRIVVEDTLLLFSLYDIPVHEFGAALISKNIHVCYAAFHFAEALLLDQTDN